MNSPLPFWKLLFILPILFFACSKKKTENKIVTPPPVGSGITFDTATYQESAFTFTNIFVDTPVVAIMQNQNYKELSGIAAGKVNPALLYVEEDSGNPNYIFLTNAAGADLGYLILKGTNNRDWEDIAVGPGPEPGTSYIYMPDIGDNDARYPSIEIYRLKEPDLKNQNFPVQMDQTQIDQINLKYPDGPRNAECILIDPKTADIYIVSKESGKAKVYLAPFPQSTDTTIILKPLLLLPFDKVTSGGISPDGTEILIKDKDAIWYWKRQQGKSIAETLLQMPLVAPYTKEYQGEGICFANDGSGYFTDTEIPKNDDTTIKSTVSFYKRK